MSEAVVITGTENINKFRHLQVVHALALEVGTGMKISSRGSALQAAKIQGIVPQNTRSKKEALKLAVAALKELDPGYVPSRSVERALSM